MAAAIVTAVILGLAALALWRTLRRPKGDFCSICSCGGCPRSGGGCTCREKWEAPFPAKRKEEDAR